MNITKISEAIGKTDNAYSYLALLPEAARQAVTQLARNLRSEIGDGLWLMSDHALHITLCEIIQPKSYTLDKQQLFDEHALEYKTIPVEIIKKVKPINVAFGKIEVSPQAITIQGTDNGSFEQIRKQMINELPFPHETRRPPDIIHCTLARFSEEIDLHTIKKIVAKHSFEHHARITEFHLTHCTKPPLEEFEILKTFSLNA